MAESKLDNIVKGTPPPDVSLSAVAAAASNRSAASEYSSDSGTTRRPPTALDPTSLLPSSPPQIYLNLLILEASFRSQYLTLRARRRQNTFVLLLLGVWIAYFYYAQYLRPREDGNGIGGSVYWVVDMGEKVALISGVVMGMLFWVTGQWERGVRWPRRWLGITNRGLRNMNCKIVVLKGPWWKEMLSHLSALLPLNSFVPTPGSSYQYIEYTASEKKQMLQHSRPRPVLKDGARYEAIEEDVASGGDHIKIMLLPKHFTPDFREDWETYRMEYWERENQRRSELRKRIRSRQREIARQEGGWLWWAGWRGWAKTFGFSAPRTQQQSDLEKPPPQHHVHSHAHQTNLREKPHRRRPSVIRDRDGSHSRSSSRSSTSPTPETEERERRWSVSTTGSAGGSQRRRKVTNADLGRSGSITGRPLKLTPANPAASSPGTPTALRNQSSSLSVLSSSTDSSEGRTTAKTTPEPVIKVERPQ